MRKRIEQLLNGKFEYEVPKLILSEDKIEKTATVGEHVRGILHVGADETMKIKGIVTVTNARIVVGTHKFTGTSVQISYGVDVTGMKAGEECRGSIVLDTNVGEYKVPVRISIEEEPVTTSRGQMNTLDDFVDLFHMNPREAFRFYTSDEFVKYLEQAAPEHVTLYKGMSENPVTYQHVEEFLVGTGKKDPVAISVEQGEHSFFNMRESLKSIVEIRRSSWGYLNIDVEVIGDFIEVTKKRITADDFVGSVCQLEYIIRRDLLYKGRRYGCILLKTVYGTKKIDITASKHSPVRVDMKAIAKRNQITLMQLYLDFCLNRIDAKAWALKTKTVLECIRQMGDYPVEYQLYEGYVSFLAGNTTDARLIIRNLEAHSFVKESLEAKAMFLYLCYQLELLQMDQADVVRRIRAYQQKKQESLIILLILLQMDEDVNRTPVKKVYYMENLYDMGCRSPILYLEAYKLLCHDIGYMRRMNDFWKTVFRYVARENLFTEEIALRVAYLSGNERTFTEPMYQILTKAYEMYPLRDILDAICKLIIKGSPRNPELFKWYELAVEQEIKITRLYEYYIETMPENYQKMLPQVIRMYFAYNNTLSDKKKAFVYANVIRNKLVDKNTYLSYQEAMAKFAKEKLLQRKINEDFAVVYQEFIKEIRSQEMAEAMAELLFTHRIYCEDKKVRNIIVCHGPLEKEEFYPCIDGVAYISLYTPDAKILFQDELCRRYVDTVEYNIQRLMDFDTYVEQCMSFNVHHIGLLLHVCRENCQESDITLQNISMFQQITESDAFSQNYQMQIRKKLLSYYALHAGDDTLDRYLSRLDYNKFAQVDKVLLIEVLISRGMYQKAFAMICQYGQEHVAVYKLVRLCSRMVEIMEYQEDEELLLLCAHVYGLGKYDERILNYLLKYYEGSLARMCQIRTSGQEFFLDTYDMDERILIYSMFIREYIEDGSKILTSYAKGGGREAVILAYLTFLAYGYYWDRQEMDENVAGLLSSVYERELDVDEVCHLALLKYYSKKNKLEEKEEQQVEDMLEMYQQKGLRLSFFQKLPNVFLQPYQLDDCIFVEQKASPTARVTLHYSISSYGDAEPIFKSEPMKMMYQSIFSREFILFYGETLTYYITVEHKDTVTETNKITVAMPNIDRKGRSRYQMINQMMAANILGKEAVLKETVRKYLQAEKVSEELFPLIK